MKLTQDQINGIRKLFNEMQTKEELLHLLNEANKLLYDEKAKPFALKSLTYFSSPAINSKRYKEFAIRKKSGGTRTIHAPGKSLKSILRALNLVLQCVFEPHEAATGFVTGKSIVDNARKHVGQNYVFNIDLKDFFPSVDQARVWKRLQYPPFNLNNETNRLELANRLAALCCTFLEVERLDESGNWIKVKRNVLPQGAPTSPTITNIIAYRMDRKLEGLARRFKINYTRYADDITFSSNHNVYQNDGEFIQELNKIIADQNFTINQKKTRLQKNGYRQETTGITVNEKVNVQLRYVKQIRMWIYYWERYGYDKAEQIFKRDYIADKGHVKKEIPSLINVLDGKLEYLKMVKGPKDATYSKLSVRFSKLTVPEIPLDNVLETWEEKGIEEAMKLYYRNG